MYCSHDQLMHDKPPPNLEALKTTAYYSHLQFCGLIGLGWVVLTWILSGRCKQMATGVDASWLGLDLQDGTSAPSHWSSSSGNLRKFLPWFLRAPSHWSSASGNLSSSFHGSSGHHEAGSPELAQDHFHHVLLVKTDTKSRPVQIQGSGSLDPIPEGQEWMAAISEVQLTCTLSLPTFPNIIPGCCLLPPLPYFILGSPSPSLRAVSLLWGRESQFRGFSVKTWNLSPPAVSRVQAS